MLSDLRYYSQVFDSALSLHEHNCQRHYYCPDCRLLFQSESNLRSHRHSRTHIIASILCPGKGCAKEFINSAALVFHWESGTCPSRITRQHLNRVITEFDKNHVITNPARMIAGGSESPTTMWATSRAWNGHAFECFLCHREHRTPESLNQHFASPAHAQKQFVCPRAYSGCGAEFKTLSALCQHVESERCGVRRFKKQVQDFIGDLTSGMKRLGI
ncbi:hypothetical protein EVJ58_g5131 [Rhodofomes roseus]|uniref:C2H2-type domain-containing protein n=1 Tax=Rhodofomes roseus TaxID=34475 RepID=A0A4Y9YEP0_9APHY|nr:hypothetical protein EVJ58_g5131 [Rhodofomes roseus]